MSTLMIMAGGTGGHVFPALAVADRLRAEGVEIVWLGTRRGLEARVVPAAGIDIEWVSIQGLRRAGALGWLLLPFRLLLAMWQTFWIMRRRRPQAVLAMGGFVAGPGGLIAALLRKPLLVHEQNAVAGFTNRWLAHIADEVMAGFPDALEHVHGARHVGNPVRAAILQVPPPDVRFQGRGGPWRVLVVGGSQGAQVFNRTLPAALQAVPAALRPQIWHQTGPTQCGQTEQAYRAAQVEAKVVPFIDDMAAAYAWADLVICRAGAMTVAELAAVGVASVLVPFPYATDDHQTANARFLADHDAAILVPEAEFSSGRLTELLKTCGQSRELMLKMANNARACAMPDATQMVARLCREAMHA